MCWLRHYWAALSWGTLAFSFLLAGAWGGSVNYLLQFLGQRRHIIPYEFPGVHSLPIAPLTPVTTFPVHTRMWQLMDNLKGQPQKHHLPLLRGGLFLAWNLPIKLGWVASDSQGSLVWCLASAWITRTCHYAHFHVESWGRT